MANIEKQIETLLLQRINNLGYNLYDVEYVKEGKDYFLRIYIDNEKGIGLDDCEKVSNDITDILDESNYIKEQYFLEVSSPGVERVLKKEKHLQENLNKEVQIKLFNKVNGDKQIKGSLKGFDNDTIILKSDEKEIKIDRKNIVQIKTIYKWE